MEEYGKIIAKNLKAIMYEHKKTQADVAKDLGINKATVSSWMNGTRIPRMPKIDLLCQLSANKKRRPEGRPKKKGNAIWHLTIAGMPAL